MEISPVRRELLALPDTGLKSEAATYPAGPESFARPGIGSAIPAPRTSGRLPALRGRHLLVLGVALLVIAINLAGSGYYLADPAVRVRHPWHQWLRPSGAIGQTAGFAALSMFLYLWLYPLRKKYRALSFTGGLAGWLEWHVAAGLLVPWVAAIHAAWRFTGLIGLAYGAMFVVHLSGLVGRYLYVHIPRRRDGIELSREELGSERERLLFELVTATGLPPREIRRMLAPVTEGCEGLGIAGTVRRMIADDLARRRAARRIVREVSARQSGRSGPDRATLRRILSLARREMAMSQQARLLEATHRVFRFWHVAHRPFAVAALLGVMTHVVVVVAVGATWIR